MDASMFSGHLQFLVHALCACVCMHVNMHVHACGDTPMPPDLLPDIPHPPAHSPELQGAQQHFKIQ